MAFICFEGLDGAGKTTLIQLLKSAIEERGHSCLVTREPGGTQLGDELRHVLLRVDSSVPHPRTEILLYEAIRAQHVEEKIRPALKRGDWILCDRFTASSIAFQSAGRALALSDIQTLNQFATAGLAPDLQVLLDLPVETSQDRTRARTKATGAELDRFEQEQNDFHSRVRASFLEQANRDPSSWLVVDALKPPIASFKILMQHIEKLKWIK
jgi:dTMP kinase